MARYQYTKNDYGLGKYKVQISAKYGKHDKPQISGGFVTITDGPDGPPFLICL